MVISKPPFHKQETPYSCVPACLRMVLSSFGREITETELRNLCDCTPFGTEALQAVDVARYLGFPNIAKHTLSLDELEVLVKEGNYPIIFIDTLPILGIKGRHALVVVEISQKITVYDPLRGECVLPRADFEAAWAIMHNLAIIIRRHA